MHLVRGPVYHSVRVVHIAMRIIRVLNKGHVLTRLDRARKLNHIVTPIQDPPKFETQTIVQNLTAELILVLDLE